MAPCGRATWGSCVLDFDCSIEDWKIWTSREWQEWIRSDWTRTEWGQWIFFFMSFAIYYFIVGVILGGMLHEDFPTLKPTLAFEGVIFGVTLVLRRMIDVILLVLISGTFFLIWELCEWVTNSLMIIPNVGSFLVVYYFGREPRDYFLPICGLQAFAVCLMCLSADFKSPLKTWIKSISPKCIISLLGGSPLNFPFYACSNPFEKRAFRTAKFWTNGKGLNTEAGIHLTPIHESNPPCDIEGRGPRDERTEASIEPSDPARIEGVSQREKAVEAASVWPPHSNITTTTRDEATQRDSRDGSSPFIIDIDDREESKVTETDSGPDHIVFTIKGVRGGIRVKKNPTLNKIQKEILEDIARHPERAFVKKISVSDGTYSDIDDYADLLEGNIYLCQSSEQSSDREHPPFSWMRQPLVLSLNFYGSKLKSTLRAWTSSDGFYMS